jgi:hypothetical protein
MSDAPKKLSPFDFLESINAGHERGKNLMSDVSAHTDAGLDKDSAEHQYSPYMVNRGLSMFNDTIFYANEMNRHGSVLPNKMQYDFLRFAIRPRKRFSKWAKKIEEDSITIDAIVKLYGYSRDKAVAALSLLTTEQKAILVNKTEGGGITSTKKSK